MTLSGEVPLIQAVEEQRFPRDLPPHPRLPQVFGPDCAPPVATPCPPLPAEIFGEPCRGLTKRVLTAEARQRLAGEVLEVDRVVFTRPDALGASPASIRGDAAPTPVIERPSAPLTAESVKFLGTDAPPASGHRWTSTGTLSGAEVGYCECGFPSDPKVVACSQAGRSVAFFDLFLRHLPKKE